MKIFKKLIWFWFGIGALALFFIIFMPPSEDVESESTEKVENVESTETAKTVEKKGRISINTYGEVSTTEQLWEDFGNPSFKFYSTYEVYFRDKYVFDLMVDKSFYDYRQKEGHYNWRSIDNPNFLDFIAYFEQGLMLQDGKLVDLREYKF